jgi:hypothetical protein
MKDGFAGWFFAGIRGFGAIRGGGPLTVGGDFGIIV